MENKYGKQLTGKQAIAFDKSKVWEDWTDEQIVRLQLFQDVLCVPFDKFKEALSSVLGRPVYTHEFTSSESLVKEYLGENTPPTFEEIVNMIPEDKRILIEL